MTETATDQLPQTRTKAPDEKFCGDCGSTIKQKAEICPDCGVRQRGMASHSTAPNGKSRIAAALLALFLGGIGVHRFYLGHIGLGFVYLLFCWTLIPGIIAFVEFILFLMMSDETFAYKHGGQAQPA